MDDQIKEFLELYPELEEAFEALDITPYEVIEVLLRHGYIELPPFLERDNEDTEDN